MHINFGGIDSNSPPNHLYKYSHNDHKSFNGKSVTNILASISIESTICYVLQYCIYIEHVQLVIRSSLLFQNLITYSKENCHHSILSLLLQVLMTKGLSTNISRQSLEIQQILKFYSMLQSKWALIRRNLCNTCSWCPLLYDLMNNWEIL